MGRGSWVAAAAAVVVALSATADALQFYLESGKEQCFTEMLQGATRVRGEYVVTAGRGDMQVKMVVRDDRNRIVFSRDNIDHGKFNFETPDHYDSFSEYEDYYSSDSEAWGSRRYQICFSSVTPDSTATLKRRVGISLHTGETSKDYNKLAKDEHLSELEVVLEALSDELNNLLADLEVVRVREDHLRKINEATNGRVVTYSITACLVMMLVGAYQMYYMRTFFKKKKLI